MDSYGKIDGELPAGKASVQLYDKPVRLLMYEMVKELDLSNGQTLSKAEAIAWFEERYPLVKEGTIAAHLLRLSINSPARVHYNVRVNGDDDLFYQIHGSLFRLYDPSSDPAPIYEKKSLEGIGTTNPDETEGGPSNSSDASRFAYEHDLRDYLAKNLDLVESGLQLYEEEEITGLEFPAGGRYIDILAVDSLRLHIIIELKISRGYDRVVGQLLRYLAWIEKHHAEPGKSVRGVIIAKEITEDLRLACSRIQGVSLLEYDLSVTLRKVQ